MTGTGRGSIAWDVLGLIGLVFAAANFWIGAFAGAWASVGVASGKPLIDSPEVWPNYLPCAVVALVVLAAIILRVLGHKRAAGALAALNILGPVVLLSPVSASIL